MADQKDTFSCEFIPSDIQRHGLSFIQVEGLYKRFSDKPDSLGLRDFSFGIEQGEITAIVGESGSGKSTLLRLIYGLLAPDQGEIRFKGWKVPGPDDKLIPGHDAMRMVSQHFDDLNTYANVWDNVASRLSNTNLQEKEEKTEIALRSLDVLRLAKQRVADLSGGEKQRVAIARALVTGPEVLLMDEPFNQVDASFRDHLQRDIRRIVDEMGLTVILVSHDPSEVLALSDALLILKGGHLMAAGRPSEIYSNPPNAYAATILAKSNVLSLEEAGALISPMRSPVNASAEVIIHPEWLRLEKVEGATMATVKEVLFRGFFEEITLQIGGVSLRAVNKFPGAFRVGDGVNITVERFVVVGS